MPAMNTVITSGYITSYATAAPLLFLLAQVFGLVLEESFQFSILDIAVELQKDELKNIVQSVNYMTDKVKKELLENLPSSEEGRKRLDDYAALKEDLRKILEDLR
jgi:hypothetical protein